MKELLKLRAKYSYLGEELIQEIARNSEIKAFPANTELVRQGQYLKVVPIVLEGLVKVFTHSEDRDLLLYYIEPDQSCIMSFSSCLKNEQSKIFAVTESETTLLLLPSNKIGTWINEYPTLNLLFYQQFDLRYSELLERINHLIQYRLDKRLLEYLTTQIKITGKNPIKISHRKIAYEIGTAREVVSRLLKKLENENIIKQHHDSIEIFHIR